MGDRIRWRIAYLLNRLPGQCWADLATWAGQYGPEPIRNPWSPIDRGGRLCREDLIRCGACYCGKLRAPEPAVTGGGSDVDGR